MELSEQLLSLIGQIAAFGLVFSIWVAAVVLWLLQHMRRERRLEERLGMIQESHADRVLRLWHEGKAVETMVPGRAQRSVGERLELLGQRAGWSMPMGQVLLLYATAVLLVGVMLLLLTHNPLLTVAIAVVMLVVFRAVLQYSINRREAIFEKQLVDALDLAARSLRAGHPLSGAFKLIADEIEDPVGGTFREITEQEQFGVSLQDSLKRTASRSESSDMRIFATSVAIQLRSGGNLADMMERVAWVIRERMRLSRRARVLTAEAHLSKWVLLSLPLGMLVLLTFINPEYMEPMYQTFVGKMMLVGGAVFMVIGAWMMNWMARLDY